MGESRGYRARFCIRIRWFKGKAAVTPISWAIPFSAERLGLPVLGGWVILRAQTQCSGLLRSAVDRHLSVAGNLAVYSRVPMLMAFIQALRFFIPALFLFRQSFIISWLNLRGRRTASHGYLDVCPLALLFRLGLDDHCFARFNKFSWGLAPKRGR